VSLTAARDDYGVVLVPDAGADSFMIDAQATASLRAKLTAGRGKDWRMIDRGNGYAKMLRGDVVPWTRSA
jgi:N-methylhydantoinase B